jgi:hypothetical protein
MDIITLFEFAALVGRLRRLQVAPQDKFTRETIISLEREVDQTLIRIQDNIDRLNLMLKEQ